MMGKEKLKKREREISVGDGENVKPKRVHTCTNTTTRSREYLHAQCGEGKEEGFLRITKKKNIFLFFFLVKALLFISNIS